MCGILGYHGRPDPQTFERALERLTPRGPDGSGTWRDERITLGHRRLAILDTSERGDQPLEILDRYVIAYNGEIYNFEEIRAELEPEGIVFRSDSDTEVLLHAFAKWGPACLDRLNGMWALGIWDRREHKLFLSRDRFGKKPLFYARAGDAFVFASEMKALFPFLPDVRPSDEFDWCKTHLNDYESTDRCLIAGIRRFPAGHYGWLREGELTLTRYWDTMDSLVDVPSRYEDQVERFRELFLDACKLRMRSDVPIGTALSGGLDSSAVACSMARIGNHERDRRMSSDWQHAFVATFPGTHFDERRHAEKVVEHTGIRAEYLPIDPVAGIESLPDYLWGFEELHLTSPIPMVETYKAVRRHGVVVTLDGHGADECLAGYGQEVFKAFRDAGLSLGRVRDILAVYRGMIDIDSPQMPKTRYDLGYYVRYMGGKKAWAKFALDCLLGRQERESIPDRRFGQFSGHLYTLFHQTVLPTLLRNYDRYAMMNGVEIRMPFMDHRLVSFVFSLPWTSKLREGYTKRIVRDALDPIMPPEVTWRTSKIGFNTPIVDWMKGPWKSFVLDVVHSTAFAQSGLVDATEVRQMVTDVIEKPDASYMEGERAWAALMPHLWETSVLRREFESRARTAAAG
ncbi:MAG: asparagine synthase (glutamine-hydrolyzing) [Phycisphaeraceae bacterium]|nr:asparagine synthase (glutamine-hydrolyzing) [Phycisphaeraceae bacterium]